MDNKLKAKIDENLKMTGARRPTAVWCQTCKNSQGNPPWENEPEKPNCKIYQYGESLKPRAILFDGAECDFYEDINE